MKKKNVLRRNEDKVFTLFVAIVIFLVLSLVIPAIGASATSPALWIRIVAFFVSVQVHFTSFWMFYMFIATVLFAYYAKHKKVRS